jgi:hypothetical protein
MQDGRLMSSASNSFYSGYSFLFVQQIIMPLAHKACSKAQKVERLILISFNVFFTVLKVTEAGQTLMVGLKHV